MYVVWELGYSVSRILWGEHEQAACIIATEERMRYQNVSEMTTVVVRKFVVTHCWQQSTLT